MQQNGWSPVESAPLHSKSADAPFAASLPAQNVERKVRDAGAESKLKWNQTVTVLARTAIVGAVEGRSQSCFERDVARMRLAGIDVDGAGAHSRHFCRDIEFLCGKVMEMMNANEWSAELPGIGIESDFSLMADPISLGCCTAFPRNESVLVANLTISSASNGSLTTPMLGYRSLGIGSHSSQGLVKLMLEIFSDHPAAMTMPVLRARLAMVDGDGAIVRGGPRHRHNGSGAAESLWSSVHPESADGSLLVCTRWDDFHRRGLCVLPPS